MIRGSVMAAVAAVAAVVVGGVTPAAGQEGVGPVDLLEPGPDAVVTVPFVVVVANGAAPGSEGVSQVQVSLDGASLDPRTGTVAVGGGGFFDIAAGERREIVVDELAVGRHELELAVVSPGNLDPQVTGPVRFTVAPPGGAGQAGYVAVLGLLVLGLVLMRRRLMSRHPRAE